MDSWQEKHSFSQANPFLLLWPLKMKCSKFYPSDSYLSPGGERPQLHRHQGAFFPLEMLNVHGKNNLPGNVHLGAARFQEAESRGNKIIVLTLGKRAAKLPQAKKAGPLHPFLFHLSVWMGHRKSTQWRSQHRSQISSVHMGLTFWADT